MKLSFSSKGKMENGKPKSKNIDLTNAEDFGGCPVLQERAL